MRQEIEEPANEAPSPPPDTRYISPQLGHPVAHYSVAFSYLARLISVGLVLLFSMTFPETVLDVRYDSWHVLIH